MSKLQLSDCGFTKKVHLTGVYAGLAINFMQLYALAIRLKFKALFQRANRMKIRLFFFFLFWASLSNMIAEELVPGPKMIFEENKNQWPEQVLFEADFAGGKLFLEKNKFTYLLIERIDLHSYHRSDESFNIRYHSFKVNFLNSNAAAEVSGNIPFGFHRNYYLGNEPGHWAEGVKLYQYVSYQNLYSNIDMKVYNADKNLKYDFIIKPGGNAEDIQFNYEGADKLYIKNGSLFIQTSLGEIVEQKPYSYQVVDGKKTEVRCSFRLAKNTLGFSVEENYNNNLPLIIDPILIASTYTGSFADNWGFTATYDDAGNIYTAGIAASAGYPTTIGAFDNTFNGGMPWDGFNYPFDISITKYNAAGTAIMFSTYYGGAKNEQPHSLFVNSSNQLFLTGRTNSINFPTTAGAYDVTLSGGYDIIVGKFNSSGALLASTFVGGTGDDGVNIHSAESVMSSLKFNYADDGRSEIILDGTSNVYIAGCTRSTDFPASAGAYDATLGGTQDGCVLKMNSSLSALIFSTYLGGSVDDAAYGIKLNGSNVYVTGGTASNDFPTTAGVLNPTYKGGAADGYITAFNSTGTAIVYSTFLGTSEYDQSYLIETDASSDIYVYGQTKGTYPVTPGTYSNPNSGQFIHKLNGQLNTTLFSTVVGSGVPNPNISPTAFLVDSCQSIYIAGWARCGPAFGNPSPQTVTGMPVTSNAYKSTTDGCDFYFMVLRPNAQSLLYATFFGENSWIGDHVDGGTSRFDKRGFIYQSVCASCGGSDNFPTTTTAWSRTNNNFNCNNAVIKMDLQVNPDAVANLVGSPVGCVPYTVPFSISGSVGTNFKWDFGDGSPQVSVPSPSHTYTNTGTYTATLYVSDTTGTCGKVDSAKVVINVGSPPVLQMSQTSVFCNGGNNGTATIAASGGLTPYTYLWNNGQTKATATGLSAGTYTVTTTNSYGCAATATATITEPSVLAANSSFTNVGCYGGANGTATATVSGGTGSYSYVWLPGGYTTSSVSGLSIGNYTVSVTDAKGCTASATANITQPPALAISAATTAANCGQANGSATVSGTGGFAPYTWTWSGGQTGATVTGLVAGTYTVTIQDVNLCTTSAPVSIANISGPVATLTATDISCNGLNDGTATLTTTGGTLPFTYLWNNGQTTPTATNLAAGIYSVIATDAINCSATASITISEPPVLAVNAVGISPSCNGFLDGSVQAGVLGGTAPYTFSWAIPGNPTTAVVPNLPAGAYSVAVTDAEGCVELASVTLTNPPAISISIADTSVLCAGDCNGKATATVSNGFTPYMYSWSDSAQQGTPSATGLCTGTYSLSVTDAHGCPANAAATINTPLPLTASVLSRGNVTCNGLCDGFIQLAVLGGTPQYSYSWLPGGGTNATVTGLCAGSYACKITDANGCSFIITDTVTEPELLNGAVNVVKIPCNSMCNGEIFATFSGGNPPYTYVWQPGLQTTNNPTTLCAATHTVTVRDSLGCTAGGSVLLTEPPPLTATVSTTDANCGQANGGACVVAAGGTLAYSYKWSSAQSDTLACVSGLVANTYNITVTDGMGCTHTANANINDTTGPVLTIASSTALTCFGIPTGTAAVNVSGGIAPYLAVWSPGGQTGLNPNTLAAGINTVSVTDNAGCISSASVTINTPDELVSAITAKQNVSCYSACDGGATVLYDGGTGTLSVVWDSPGNPATATVSGLCAGDYNVTITDANGCVRIDSLAIIAEPNALVIQNSTVTNILCTGDDNGVISAGVNGGTPFYTFSWAPNVGNGPTATNLAAGTYTLSVTDMSACVISQTFTITDPPLLTASGSSNPASCNLSNGDATVIVSGGSVPYVYQWNDLNLQTNFTALNLSSSDFICVVKDANNCVIRDTITVGSTPGPAIDSVVSTAVLCNGGASGTASVYLTNGMGTAPFNYLWTPSSQTGTQATGLQQGAYTVLVTDVDGCTANGSVIVNEPPALLLVVSQPDTVCYRDTAQVYAQGVGGVPNYLYSWFNAGFGLSGTGPHIVIPDSNSVYSVIVSDANGCTAGPLNMQIVLPPALLVAATADIIICDGDTATISVNASGGNGNPYSYLWSNSATTQSQMVFPAQAFSPVTYVVTVTDGCSRPATDSTVVTVNVDPTGSFTQNDTSGCEPLIVTFNASSGSSGVTYTWDYGDGTAGSGASSSHTYISDSTYTVTLTITTAQGCSASIQGVNTITVNPKPDADFLIDPVPASSLYPLVNYTDISTTPIVSWQWSFNDPSSASNTATISNPSHTYGGVGIYTTELIVMNQYGCSDTVSEQIDVIDEFVFYAPNTFTPNEDDVNEVFLPLGAGWDIATYELYIFDRWGELIFFTEDYAEGWNGKAKGGTELVQNDVYVWKVNLKDVRGSRHRYIGHVTMLK